MEDGGCKSISGKLGYIDVGARGGSASRLAPFMSRLSIVLVEPDDLEADRLRQDSLNGSLYTVIQSALGHSDGDIDLYIAKNPTCTSALPVAQSFLRKYGIGHHFETKSVEQVKSARYDTLYDKGGLPVPHIIKADVQGYEYEVLQGFGRHLHDCMIIEVEAHFYEIYASQRLFGEIVHFLSTFDFVLRSISQPRSPSLKGDPHFGGDLIEIDAIFSKNRKWFSSRSLPERQNFEFACEVMDIDPYAE